MVLASCRAATALSALVDEVQQWSRAARRVTQEISQRRLFLLENYSYIQWPSFFRAREMIFAPETKITKLVKAICGSTKDQYP